MGEAMRGCLSLTSSGFAFASHDIGGFEVGGSRKQWQNADALSQGSPPAGDISKMGSLRNLLFAFKTPWKFVL